LYFSSSAGRASRDFIYVDDIVGGLIACAADGEAGDVYNIASGVETPILVLAELVNRLTGNPAAVELRPARGWDHSGKRFGSTDKAKRALGFAAGVDLATGLGRTIAWTREHLPLIDACIAKHASRLVAVTPP